MAKKMTNQFLVRMQQTKIYFENKKLYKLFII
jgi:hypothetical protein